MAATEDEKLASDHDDELRDAESIHRFGYRRAFNANGRNEDNNNINELFYFDSSLLPADFRAQSFELAHDIMWYICNCTEPRPASSKTATIMRSLVEDALVNRLDLMRELVDKLEVDHCEQLEVLDSLVTQMFDDEIVTWGRIVTLYAFCGYLARYCHERHITDCVQTIAQSLGDIVVNRLGLWIIANGGWASFDEQFPALCMFDKSSLWKIAAFVGLLLGVIFAFYTSLQILNPTTT